MKRKVSLSTLSAKLRERTSWNPFKLRVQLWWAREAIAGIVEDYEKWECKTVELDAEVSRFYLREEALERRMEALEDLLRGTCSELLEDK